MPRADSTRASTGVPPPSRSKVSVTCSAASVLASITPASPGRPLSASTSPDQNSVDRSLMRTQARFSPEDRYSTTSARAAGLRAGSTASSMSSTIWSARESWALSNSSVRAPLTSSHERAIPGSTFRPLCTGPFCGPGGGASRRGSGGGAAQPVEQADPPVDVDPPSTGPPRSDQVEPDQLGVAARRPGVGPQQRQVLAADRVAGDGVQRQLQAQLGGRCLGVEVAQALGVGGGQLAVVGVPHPQHLSGSAQDQPAHREPEVVVAGVEQLQLGAEGVVVVLGVGAQPLHRLAADQLVVEVPVGGGLPVVLGVDRPADGEAADQRVPDLDQQWVQPPHGGIGGVVHGAESAGRVRQSRCRQDRVVSPAPLTVVTGGSRGIRAATLVPPAGLGHDVVVGYRSGRAEADAVVSEAVARGVRAIAVRADVSDPDDVDALFAAAGELGTVTGLVANAGLTAHLGDLADTPVDVVRQVIDVNLLGVVLCTRRAAQLMSRRRGGSGGAIVAVSSSAATLGSAHEYVHYAAAKAGVDALVVGLAKELADDGVRVNAVAPGLVRTGIHAGAGDPGRLERVSARVPMGRPGEPEEIAAAIAWLLSPEAGYCTGAVLRVSGGL